MSISLLASDRCSLFDQSAEGRVFMSGFYRCTKLNIHGNPRDGVVTSDFKEKSNAVSLGYFAIKVRVLVHQEDGSRVSQEFA